jgi:hypothetical protein
MAAAKRGRGRPKGVTLTEEHRDKIRKSNIFRHLLDHAEGKREMSQTQVTVALALMKKVLPDLSSVEHTGSDDNPLNVAHTIRLVAGGRDTD